MKSIPIILGTVLISLLAGCASAPVYLAPIGPNPARISTATDYGQLQVYSVKQLHRDGNEYGDSPIWYQHADYTIYNRQGALIKRVSNSVGRYEEEPPLVALPAGKYVVRTESRDYQRVNAPVIIKPGQTTRLHLDDNWLPPLGTPYAELVRTPNGRPVGWMSD